MQRSFIIPKLRTIKSSPKVGTISRALARKVAKAVISSSKATDEEVKAASDKIIAERKEVLQKLSNRWLFHISKSNIPI